ncbi:hypothetical protein [Paraclostridium bifermentans]|uniref:hypothetical protein n=1 Tax=Paraclostridium bifermentans TaxID=1490 RepID=UPI0021C42CDC|nr:hypothetical protein [Paraclostridium bifermentans]GKZ07188.1 hypothetical protein ANS015_20710 [Paraclostridium bifermentans]
MPLPLILGVGAAIAGTVGVGSGVYGAAKMKEANDTMKSADSHHKSNIEKFEKQSKVTSNDMDNLGKKELEILESFELFTNVFEKIQGRPQFKTYSKDGVNIPEYDSEELKKGICWSGFITWWNRGSSDWDSRRVCSSGSNNGGCYGTWNSINRNSYCIPKWGSSN